MIPGHPIYNNELEEYDDIDDDIDDDIGDDYFDYDCDDCNICVIL